MTQSKKDIKMMLINETIKAMQQIQLIKNSRVHNFKMIFQSRKEMSGFPRKYFYFIDLTLL